MTKRLYVKCPSCRHVTASGYKADSPTQLIGFSYLCLECGSIFPCGPPDYLEKINDKFIKAMKDEEMFVLPQGPRILIQGPDLFPLNQEVIVKSGAILVSDRAIGSFKPKERG